jgi:GTP diphosphokinase / guanosine-3',5'-bis(diphosphate) 3'-diphosphatase
MTKAEFFKLISATLDRKSLLRIRNAYRIAKDVHRNQRRKAAKVGENPRYFEHPRAVALISMRYSVDPDLIICCLLHDVLEDGDDPLDAEEIELFFGESIIRTIRGVSKVPKDGFHERFAKYSDWRARWVKACDRLHNLQTLPPGDAAFRQKQVRETLLIYMPLFEEMVGMVPPQYTDGARALQREILTLCA